MIVVKFKDKRLLFFLILLLSISMRLVCLDKGYSADEGWILQAAELDVDELIPTLSEGMHPYPPLSPILLHFWVKLSKAEIWIRSYFVLFGIALCILIYFIGNFYIDKRFGLMAFFISAVSPLLIWSSQFVRCYIDSAFWVTLSVYFMLRILKGANFWRNSLGYIFFSGLALYSSYTIAFILAAQNIFVLIFCFRNPKFLKKWLILQLLVAAVFAPCLALLLKQMNLAPVFDPLWSKQGFQLFGLHVGSYARSIAATVGMDPGFLTLRPLTRQFDNSVLFVMAGLSFCIIAAFLISALKNLKAVFENKQLRYFFPAILGLSLIIFAFLIELKNVPVQAEYFIPQHILFIFILSSVVYSVKRRSKLNILAVGLIVLVFLLRYPQALKPEFDTKKAYGYLVNNIKTTDCLLMVRKTNRYIDPQAFNTVVMYDFLHKNSVGDYYKPLNNAAEAMLSGLKEKYENICFYRTYSNDEMLGANKLIMNWLDENGYKIEDVQKFRRIDIICYNRRSVDKERLD